MADDKDLAQRQLSEANMIAKSAEQKSKKTREIGDKRSNRPALTPQIALDRAADAP